MFLFKLILEELLLTVVTIAVLTVIIGVFPGMRDIVTVETQFLFGRGLQSPSGVEFFRQFRNAGVLFSYKMVKNNFPEPKTALREQTFKDY